MPSGGLRKHEVLDEQAGRRLLAEYDALPRQPDGRVVASFTALLARKWGLSTSGMLGKIKHLREANRAAV